MKYFTGKYGVGLSLLAILFCLIVHFTVIAGQKKEISHLQKTHAELRRSLNAHDASDPVMAQRFRQAVRDLEKLKSTLPLFQDFPHVLTRFDGLVKKNGLTASEMQFVPEKAGRPGLWRYQSQFKVTGPYPGIKRFIAEIQSVEGIHTLSALQFKRSDEAKRGVDVTMGIEIYCREEGL